MTARKYVYITWTVVAVGMAARLAWVLFGPRAVVTDAAAYRALAQSLARGAGYASAAGPTAYWVPGWPAWMLLFYAARGGDLAVALSNVALGALTVAATYALARRAHGIAVARAAAAIVALWPSLVVLPGLLLSENLAIPCTVAVVLLMAWAASPEASPLRWLAAGLACGAAILVREACVALLLAGVVLAIRRRTPVPVTAWAALLVAATFVLSPWVARNQRVVGATVLATSAGVNLCIAHGDGATGGYRQLDARALGGSTDPGPAGERARRAGGLRCAREGLARHPLRPVVLAPSKLARLFARDDWAVDDFFAPEMRPRSARWLRIACDGVYWLVLVLAVRGVLGEGTWASPTSRACVIGLAAFVVFVLATFGGARYHALMQPLLAVFAARGALLRRRSGGRFAMVGAS